MTWHSLDPTAAVARLDSDAERGLEAGEVARRRTIHGANTLPAPRTQTLWVVFARQFRSPLIYLLFGAAAIALALGETTDAAVIAAVVVLNAVLGAYQEGRAEQALAALRKLSEQRARVVRDGAEQMIAAAELVPGDVVLLTAGDAIAADARLVESSALQIAEAALTGESVPVAKSPAAVAGDVTLADRTCMVYSGTLATAGRARAVVVATGASTELGRIAALAEGGRALATPLEHRVAVFGRYLAVAAVTLFALFVGLGLLVRLPLVDIAMVGISQVVGLVPEGLPVAMTVALAIGVQRMARRRAIVRKLSAVEALGATTVICSDKTGTLTRNEMTVRAVWLARTGEVAATGSGYGPDGALATELAPDVERLLEAGVLCNDARVLPPDWRMLGDPTEAALVTLAMKAGLDPEAVRREHPRRAEVPFDAVAKLMATQHGARVVAKGAVESLLARCDRVLDGDREVPLDDARRAEVHRAVDVMAERALRVLAFADVDGELGERGLEALGKRAVLLGLVGQIDPPREEAAPAVATCLAAGIRPVMVTGDHVVTGLAVARELGIARRDDLAVDGPRLEAMTDAELTAQLDRIAVFARVQPAQKLRIVEAYQRRGDVVAMTGDGVNDAPALARADVGVAMGITGTDVAKEAAKIVVTDDNFGSIVAAVEEGRIVHRNIKKAVLLLLSTSFAEVVILLGAVMLGFPPPLAAVQILWNNLVTEGLITVNLVMDPPEGDEMRLPPVPRGEPLVTRAMWKRVALMTPTIVAITLGWYVVRLSSGAPHDVVRTETFTLLAVCEWFNVLNCMSDRRSALSFASLRDPWLVGGIVLGNVLQVLVIYVPALNKIFHTVPLPLDHALAIGAAGSLVLWIEELRKLIARTAQAVRDREAPDMAVPLQSPRA